MNELTMNYCDWCGSQLLDDGHCPDAECVHNILLDLEADTAE